MIAIYTKSNYIDIVECMYVFWTCAMIFMYGTHIVMDFKVTGT
jgi:hypothetical protein